MNGDCGSPEQAGTFRGIQDTKIMLVCKAPHCRPVPCHHAAAPRQEEAGMDKVWHRMDVQHACLL